MTVVCYIFSTHPHTLPSPLYPYQVTPAGEMRQPNPLMCPAPEMAARWPDICSKKSWQVALKSPTQGSCCYVLKSLSLERLL